MEFKKGWLYGSLPFQYHQLPSAHFNKRPLDTEVSLLVIHNISLPPAQFGTSAIEDFFCGKLETDAHSYFEQIADLRVSAHFLIKRSGEVIQFVSCEDRAWHAGQSCFNGRENCNDYSIGIELEGTDNCEYSKVQYDHLLLLTNALIAEYPAISVDRIVGHCDIAPQRKTDPGAAFDWHRLRDALND